MATTGAAEKLCTRCKQDCAGKPRSKDAQGRYICQGCLDALRARGAGVAKPMRTAKVTPPEPPAEQDDQSVLASLLGDSPDPCPSCAAPLKQGTVLCNFCGFNKETGQAVKTRVMRAPKEKKAKVPGQSSSLTFEPMWTGLIVVGLQAALFVGCFVNPAMIIPLYAVSALCGLAGFIMLIVYCIADQNVGWLLACFIPLAGPLLMLYYVFSVSERGHLKAITLGNLAGTLMVFGAMAGIVANGQEDEIGLPRTRTRAPASDAP